VNENADIKGKRKEYIILRYSVFTIWQADTQQQQMESRWEAGGHMLGDKDVRSLCTGRPTSPTIESVRRTSQYFMVSLPPVLRSRLLGTLWVYLPCPGVLAKVAVLVGWGLRGLFEPPRPPPLLFGRPLARTPRHVRALPGRLVLSDVIDALLCSVLHNNTSNSKVLSMILRKGMKNAVAKCYESSKAKYD